MLHKADSFVKQYFATSIKNVQGFLYADGSLALARSISEPGQLQPLCGTDAVGSDAIVLFPDDATRRNDWDCLGRFHSD